MNVTFKKDHHKESNNKFFSLLKKDVVVTTSSITVFLLTILFIILMTLNIVDASNKPSTSSIDPESLNNKLITIVEEKGKDLSPNSDIKINSIYAINYKNECLYISSDASINDINLVYILELPMQYKNHIEYELSYIMNDGTYIPSSSYKYSYEGVIDITHYEIFVDIVGEDYNGTLASYNDSTYFIGITKDKNSYTSYCSLEYQNGGFISKADNTVKIGNYFSYLEYLYNE